MLLAGLCFAALRRNAYDHRGRRTVLLGDVASIAAELPALRHGSTIRCGTDVLVYLAQKWGRHDLGGKSWCGAADTDEEEAAVAAEIAAQLGWLDGLREVLLRGVVLPQVFLSNSSAAGLDEIDIFAGVDRARREAETLIIDLDHRLGITKRGYLCAGRLTIADFVAVATLDGAGELIGQNWGRYPRVLAYLNRLRVLAGYDEAFRARAVIAGAAATRRAHAGAAPVII